MQFKQSEITEEMLARMRAELQGKSPARGKQPEVLLTRAAYAAEVVRFSQNIERQESGCWHWIGPHAPTGNRGRFYLCARSMFAHRFSFLHFIGEIPAGMCICHHCDNPICCNPEHLFAGTLKDNQQDSIKKGRNSPPPRGERHWSARLTAPQVLDIRRRLEAGERRKKLTNEFRLSISSIGNIAARRTWKHI